MRVARYIVLGAGAIGCGIGGSLSRVGIPVVFVARGAQLTALRERGLLLGTPTSSQRMQVEVRDVRELDIHAGDVVLCCTKTQDTQSVLETLARSVPVVCLQNGVAAERMAAARFEHAYGVFVFVPATFLEPGKVALHSSPIPGVLDVGRYPNGSDELCRALALDFARAGFRARAVPDIMRWKYGKLLGNLESAVQALAGRAAIGSDLVAALREEAKSVLAGAGIDHASVVELEERCASINDLPVDGVPRPGGSSWQSLARGTGSIESEYLNGEIVRIAVSHGLSAPKNHALTRLALRAAAERWKPGALSLDELVSRLSVQEE